ncbi:AEC family transporter [Bacillus daqingensis]|uniref:AEC family transporter n=1 Tax=Bacillus daqingensis TaxID=872396 RepID=A0ABV9NXK3_9BACI
MEFLTVVLPIFVIFAIGYIGQRIFSFDTRQLSTMALYLISPFLVFRTFYTNTLSQEYMYLLLYTLLLSGILLVLIRMFATFRNWQPGETAGVMLAGSFMNNGNYGAPLALFVFGAAGMDIAIILMVLQQIMMSTVGIFIASKGGKGGGSVGKAMMSVLKMPILHAAILGITVQVSPLSLGGAVANIVSLVADAAIPVIMIILGMQLANVTIKKVKYEMIVSAVVVRILISPLLAIVLVWFMPLDEMTKLVMILMAATPTSANITLYALRFKTEPEFVSLTTLVTTVLTLVSMPITMWFLLS